MRDWSSVSSAEIQSLWFGLAVLFCWLLCERLIISIISRDTELMVWFGCTVLLAVM